MNNWANPGSPDPWAALAQRLGTDLYLDLQPQPGEGSRGRNGRRRRDLAEALRAAIDDGRLPPGTTLPPYRSLAVDVGLARGTVSAVYQELVAEGRLTAVQGSGTRVADAVRPESPRSAPSPAPARVVRHDFALGQPNPSLFPRAEWIAATRRAIGDAADRDFGPGDPRGHERLRRSLAGYLARARGLRTDPERIVVTTSVSHIMSLLSANVFGDAVAVESHGLPLHRMTIEQAGTVTSPIGIDNGGARIEEIPPDVSAVVLTPSHQYPSGSALSPDRRLAAVEWARDTGGFIVEDDYDGELRYDRSPVGAVQALGPDEVIYTGSVSKSLSPALRIAWLVLPERLVDRLVAVKGSREPDASIIDQLVLAELIDSGGYDKHIRRSRQHYRRTRDLFIARLAESGLHVPGIAAGLHAVVEVPADAEALIAAAAHDEGFRLAPLSLFRHPDAVPPDERGGIVAGFATPAASAWTAAVDALAELLRRHLDQR